MPVTSKAPYGVPMWMRCTRCGTERRDYLDASSGSVRGRRYLYPEHYLYEGTRGEAPTRSEWRRELLRTYLSERRAERRASKLRVVGGES
jgi:hypothetical protein